MGWMALAGLAAGIGGSIAANKAANKHKYNYDGEKPFVSLRHIPETEQYYLPTLKERIAGRNVGFSQDVMNQSTAPYATARRAMVSEYETPAITGAASARGLGRSSLVTSQIGQAQKEASRDIEQRIADIVLKNEVQKRTEINQAVQDIGNWTFKESDQRTNRAMFDAGQYDKLFGVQKQVDTNNAQTISNVSSMISNALSSYGRGSSLGGVSGSSGGSGSMGGMLSSIVGSGNQGSQYNQNTYAEILSVLNNRNAGTTRISGWQ